MDSNGLDQKAGHLKIYRDYQGLMFSNYLSHPGQRNIRHHWKAAETPFVPITHVSMCSESRWRCTGIDLQIWPHGERVDSNVEDEFGSRHMNVDDFQGITGLGEWNGWRLIQSMMSQWEKGGRTLSEITPKMLVSVVNTIYLLWRSMFHHMLYTDSILIYAWEKAFLDLPKVVHSSSQVEHGPAVVATEISSERQHQYRM